MRLIKLSCFLTVIIAIASVKIAMGQQDVYFKHEKVLCAKKWTLREKQGLKGSFQIGDQWQFLSNRLFEYWRNEQIIIKGRWVLDEHFILIIIDEFIELEEQVDTLPTKLKIVEIDSTEIILKVHIDERGKIWLR